MRFRIFTIMCLGYAGTYHSKGASRMDSTPDGIQTHVVDLSGVSLPELAAYGAAADLVAAEDALVREVNSVLIVSVGGSES
jgi:hypothetical protein